VSLLSRSMMKLMSIKRAVDVLLTWNGVASNWQGCSGGFIKWISISQLLFSF